MNPERARELLTAELAELDERAGTAAADRTDTIDPDTEGAVGQHPGDYGSDVAATMDADLLVDTVATQRRHVLDALERLDTGGYGTCTVGGATIDDERLEARPEVPTCREHADTTVGA